MEKRGEIEAILSLLNLTFYLESYPQARCQPAAAAAGTTKFETEKCLLKYCICRLVKSIQLEPFLKTSFEQSRLQERKAVLNFNASAD